MSTIVETIQFDEAARTFDVPDDAVRATPRIYISDSTDPRALVLDTEGRVLGADPPSVRGDPGSWRRTRGCVTPFTRARRSRTSTRCRTSWILYGAFVAALIHDGDGAMYHAKKSGRARIEIFNQEVDPQTDHLIDTGTR